jgi:putrescine aminotransferase
MTHATATCKIITLEEALALKREEVIGLHEQYLNPRMMKVYEFIGLNHVPVRAEGAHFWDASGTRYTDVLSAFGALAFGHNPPELLNALEMLRDRGVPNMVDGPGPLPAALAKNLAMLAPGDLKRVYLANSGTEAVDAAIKLARSATGRSQLVACRGAYHGRSIGALSVMDRQDYRRRFEPLLAGVQFVNFGDADELEAVLKARKAAAFVVETIQGEGGMVAPPPGYMERVRRICSETGTLFVLDEIQCGLGRSGKLFAFEHFCVEPDCLLLGKALGGGVMPLSALITTGELWKAGMGDRPESPFHMSTYGANSSACAVGLRLLEMLCADGVIPNAAGQGDVLAQRLRELKTRHPLIDEVCGTGLMAGFRLARAGFVQRIIGDHADGRYLLSALLLQRLIVKHQILTAVTLNNADVIRVQPPLNVASDVIDAFIDALDESLTYLSAQARSLIASLPSVARFLSGYPAGIVYE